MATSFFHGRPIPPRPDFELQAANKHMQSAREAATRGAHATNRAQVKDSIASARLFLVEAEKVLNSPELTKISP